MYVPPLSCKPQIMTDVTVIIMGFKMVRSTKGPNLEYGGATDFCCLAAWHGSFKGYLASADLAYPV